MPLQLNQDDVVRLKDLDLIAQTRTARRDSMNLLDEQGLAALALAVANLLNKIVQEPESIIKEYAK